MRLVIDSNVWISALVFGGNPRQVFKRVVSDGWKIIVSEEVLTEVRRILHKKFPEFITDFDDLVVVLTPHIKYVRLGTAHEAVSRDADDDMVIETSIIGRATYIVSGDKDLLVLRRYRKIQIVDPRTFLEHNPIKQ